MWAPLGQAAGHTTLHPKGYPVSEGSVLPLYAETSDLTIRLFGGP